MGVTYVGNAHKGEGMTPSIIDRNFLLLEWLTLETPAKRRCYIIYHVHFLQKRPFVGVTYVANAHREEGVSPTIIYRNAFLREWLTLEMATGRRDYIIYHCQFLPKCPFVGVTNVGNAQKKAGMTPHIININALLWEWLMLEKPTKRRDYMIYHLKSSQ